MATIETCSYCKKKLYGEPKILHEMKCKKVKYIQSEEEESPKKKPRKKRKKS